jgi:hypothetical protein
MRQAQRVDHAQHHLDGSARRQCTVLSQVLGQRPAFDELKHHQPLTIDHVGLEHRHDVRMRQPGDGQCLTQPAAIVARGGRGRHQLERDLALQTLIEGPPYRGLGAATEVILTGASAGGIGAWINANYLVGRVPPSARVTVAPVAGMYFFAYPYAGVNHTGSELVDFREAADALAFGALADVSASQDGGVAPSAPAALPSAP